MIDVLMLPGTFCPHGSDNISEEFLRDLDPARFSTRIVDYPAEYGSPGTYYDSRVAGREALLNAIGESPNDVVIGGYSQGAQIAGDVAAEVSSGQHPELRVRGAALIADPSRPRGRCVGGDPGGWGIAGERDTGMPTWWAAATGDPITALPAGNPLRTLADMTEFYSLSSSEAAARWARHMLDTALARNLQPWWNLDHWQDWGGAVAWMKGYLTDGRHTTAYLAEGHCKALADALNEEIA
ncbi:PE-PPE domain-containing protein [Nocardia sp. NBC_01503]|uniref:alpha/beta fold hydrolase n=1 Tax=Nocardia sp. NBC_01503 TaxID=2975997 RepID=UPI002E7B00DF|nr:alpha/beta fold hydrolase [Nocardia sp. NBC_01503]WTL29184.1 PE-PPE domain-containing protein [Nocardia sp. NBC_01503]